MLDADGDRTLADLLDANSFQTHLAATAQEAIAALRAVNAKLVILQLGPRTSGYEFMWERRLLGELQRNVPVMVMGASATHPLARHAAATFELPASPIELLLAAKAATSRRRSPRRAASSSARTRDVAASDERGWLV